MDGAINKVHGQTTHGYSGRRVGKNRVGVSSVYRTWMNMKQRCTNPKISTWKYYGGRGIKMDLDWLSFENFLRDMGEKPSSRHTLERVNTNENYCKENCKWETMKVQSNNRRVNHLETYKGETLTMMELSEKYNISYTKLRARLNILKWPIEKAIETK